MSAAMVVALALALTSALAPAPLSAPVADATTLGYARAFGGATAGDSANASAMAVDAAGSVYLTGGFNGSVDFDPGPGSNILTAPSGAAGYIVKLNEQGQLVSTAHTVNMQVNGRRPKGINGVALDASGAAYVFGNIGGANPGDPDQMFVARIEANGNLAWVKLFSGAASFGQTYLPAFSGIAVDALSNVYLTGSFFLTIDFDPDAGTANLTSAGQQDAFVIKLDSAGSLAWAKQFGGFVPDLAYAVATDHAGHVYVTGMFTETVDFDPGPGVFNLIGGKYPDVFVVKLSSSGDLVWAKQLAGNDIDVGTGVQVGPDGSVYVTGDFRVSADFDPGPGVVRITSAGNTDGFVVKLNGNGDLVWARAFGGVEWERMWQPRIDRDNNVYVTGTFMDTVDFDPGPGTHHLSDSSGEAFVLKLDDGGGLAWVEQFTAAPAFALDSVLNVYMAGTFQGTQDFDPGPGTVNLTSNTGAPDKTAAFVVKRLQVAPPVNGLPASPQVMDPDTTLVFSTARGNRISLADGDNGSSPLWVDLTVNSGALTLATTAGLSFSQGDGAADASMTFTGTLSAINAAFDGLTFTPGAGATSVAMLNVLTYDQLGPGRGQVDNDALTILIGRRPTATNDTYSVTTGATLTRDAASGVLANDSDPDTPTASLQAQVVTEPPRGKLTLQTDGSFTYTPSGGSSGTDTFTYRVTDPQGISATATVSITISAVVCGPRPTVQVTTSVSNGALQAQVSVTETGAPTSNRLRSIQFGVFQNAVVTLNGQSVASGQSVTLPTDTTTQTFTVRRQTAGQATTVPLTVTDACGSWPTFVGGGTGAGF